ncbi:histidine phosphatase [Flagelloscypha sp. PMI_526]|nr:histidine phosphatase [Flagelloscypha sp. PMI_526]
MYFNATSIFGSSHHLAMLAQSSLSFFSTFLMSSVLHEVSNAAVVYYPPANTTISNLTFALHGSGRPGIYNSSQSANYGEYNWCNMPHVRREEYQPANSSFKLQYIEVIHRHHKRTPYSSNTFFKEDVAWDCSGEGPVYYGRNLTGAGAQASVIQWAGYRDPQNPFSTSIGPGFVNSNCQFPQQTAEALEDAHTHGADLRKVYGRLLRLGDSPNLDEFRIRVTNNVITSQVAGSIVSGLFPNAASRPVAAFIQPSNFDSLEPTISCGKASSIKASYTTDSGSDSQLWRDHLSQAADLYTQLDSISGISNPDNAGWHASFDHYYDNLSAKQCHAKTLPCSVNATESCLTQEQADTVYRLGNWEYWYQYRGAPKSADYAALRFGPWFLELKSRLSARLDGTSPLKYVHNVAHDGSMSALLGFLQIDEMVWPGMGAEVVFELHKEIISGKPFIRVLWSGRPMKTSTPLGTLDFIPLDKFIAYIDTMVGSGQELVAVCNS